jgi:lysophospholipase L1-like esterase
MPGNKVFRVLLASNSQGTSIGVLPDQNYSSILHGRFGSQCEVHRLLISGWTLKDLSDNLTDNVILLAPDVVVLHFGIIEGAQRILSNWEKRFLSVLPLGERITGLLHRNRAAVLRFRKYLGLQARQVSLREYSDSVREVSACLTKHKIQCLFVRTPLFPDGGDAVSHPFINEDVEAYNAALNGYPCVDTANCRGGWVSDDYQFGTVHFNAGGHQKIADLLFEEITKRLSGEISL